MASVHITSESSEGFINQFDVYTVTYEACVKCQSISNKLSHIYLLKNKIKVQTHLTEDGKFNQNSSQELSLLLTLSARCDAVIHLDTYTHSHTNTYKRYMCVCVGVFVCVGVHGCIYIYIIVYQLYSICEYLFVHVYIYLVYLNA